ncbi:hypothetical protein Acr_21g0003680 [Actinidia rufa]|uniref:Uncharacterized protein n=1 Tax=Actinidia rufa TaxID=165716 RepID=A0A7J0GG39_9ERIC|nr:hypothetical protein Acr_21g0003680 [Actinidia rufa]
MFCLDRGSEDVHITPLVSRWDSTIRGWKIGDSFDEQRQFLNDLTPKRVSDLDSVGGSTGMVQARYESSRERDLFLQTMVFGVRGDLSDAIPYCSQGS